MKNFYSKIYNKLDKDKIRYKNPFKNILRAPVDFYMEYVCRKFIWRDFIVKEMITNDDVFAFLDENDFEYNGVSFRKMEVINSASFYDRPDYDEAISLVKKDWIVSVIQVLKRNFSFDIDEYITLLADVRVEFTQNNGERYRSKVYEVILQYYRESAYRKVKRNLFIFLSILAIILALISIMCFIV